MKPTRVAIYYRVSTEGQTVENQVLDLKKYCEARHWHVVETFVDHGISAMKYRNKLDNVMALARRRRIDVLLVWAYDRFARSTIHLLTILDELRALSVDFVSFAQQIDTTTPAGRLFYTITAGFAEYERSMIVERTKAGLRRVKANGQVLGRPMISPELRAQVMELRRQGTSLQKIADQITWLRASGKYGPRKIENLSKSAVKNIVDEAKGKRRANIPPQNVALRLDGTAVA